VLDKNPLENIRNTNTIRYVMKNGRLYEGETLNEVWPRQRALAAQYWQGGVPAAAARIASSRASAGAGGSEREGRS